MKKLAFTLAELMVTLSIVGVIAVLTIPNVAKNVYQKTYVSALETVMENVTASFRTMMLNERVNDIRDINLWSGYFGKYLKIVKKCNSTRDCYADNYTSISGDDFDIAGIISGRPTVVLPSGAVITINVFELSDKGNSVYYIVDVNGKDQPNIIGRDLFTILLDRHGEVMYQQYDELSEESVSRSIDLCRSGKDARGDRDFGNSCLYLLQTNNWKMDY